MEITKENWTYTRYKNNNLHAFISIGADEQANISYFSTLIDDSNTEHFQESFTDLDAACNSINIKYQGLWDFEDQLKPLKEGGCATCVAH
jgi:hypothetical protein